MFGVSILMWTMLQPTLDNHGTVPIHGQISWTVSNHQMGHHPMTSIATTKSSPTSLLNSRSHHGYPKSRMAGSQHQIGRLPWLSYVSLFPIPHTDLGNNGTLVWSHKLLGSLLPTQVVFHISDCPSRVSCPSSLPKQTVGFFSLGLTKKMILRNQHLHPSNRKLQPTWGCCALHISWSSTRSHHAWPAWSPWTWEDTCFPNQKDMPMGYQQLKSHTCTPKSMSALWKTQNTGYSYFLSQEIIRNPLHCHRQTS